MHDYCYETAHCPSFLEYFVPYLWKCYRGKPVCGKNIYGIDKIQWNNFQTSYLAYDHGEYGGPNSCAARKYND